jgi:hypothetical protein
MKAASMLERYFSNMAESESGNACLHNGIDGSRLRYPGNDGFMIR